MSDCCQQIWLSVCHSKLCPFCGFHPIGEKPKIAEVLTLRNENRIQIKKSLNLGTCCEANPVTTQKASWYEQRSPHTATYEEHVLLQMVSSTVEDISIKEDLGYEAVNGIITRRIAAGVVRSHLRKRRTRPWPGKSGKARSGATGRSICLMP
ncbi:hypothetical protein QUF80_09610 [Desulfococcaceae bacterium HSG8]|nr:hypothetical protein [Desulfococcaceae bacterium HSG8]